MEDLQLFFNNILDSFITKNAISKNIINDFIKYFYFILDKEIKSNKSKILKNKYVKIRKNGLQYIIANKKLILSDISKKKQNK
jgi:hypothetical protein